MIYIGQSDLCVITKFNESECVSAVDACANPAFQEADNGNFRLSCFALLAKLFTAQLH